MTMRTFAFLALALAGAAGCKQGIGDRCQVDDDCESGLKCGTQNSTCFNPAMAIADASVDLRDAKIIADVPFAIDAAAADAAPPDARLPDAAAADAALADAPEGAPDAAEGTPDAAGAGKPRKR